MLACRLHTHPGAGGATPRVKVELALGSNPAARAHMAELARDPPSYMHPDVEWVPEDDVTKPYTAEAIVTVDGPAGSVYAHLPYRVQLSFFHTYPTMPPVVRFASIIYHPQIEEGGLVEDVFYDALEWSRKPNRHAKHVLSLVHQMLVEPLPGGLPLPRRVLSRIQQLQLRRARTICGYEPLHPPLFAQKPVLTAEWLDADLLAATRSRDEARMRALLTEVSPGVYSFRMATPAFCEAFLEEMAHFEASGLPKARPNSMNRYGVIVNEIGMERLVDVLQQEIICPLAELLYSEVKGCLSLDHHHTFMVEYQEGQDLGLDMHHDDSEVTLNLCLGREFTGAGLRFCGVFGEPTYRKFSYQYKHIPGQAVLHLGRQRHGADDIASGERMNLIVWNKSSSLRAVLPNERPAHGKVPPDEVCLSYTHDNDYEAFKPLPPGVLSRKERIAAAGGA
mmetsp:Transcript_18579/g.62276  ORF Transcript_18579/g.62276 Transcript_18579/m.62276 type:complete len:450 (-) Transcript_18579:139-1488(-)